MLDLMEFEEAPISRDNSHDSLHALEKQELPLLICTLPTIPSRLLRSSNTAKEEMKIKWVKIIFWTRISSIWTAPKQLKPHLFMMPRFNDHLPRHWWTFATWQLPHGAMAELNTGSGVRPWIKFQLCHLLAEWTSADYLSFQSLSFLISKTWVKIYLPHSQRLSWRWMRECM